MALQRLKHLFKLLFLIVLILPACVIKQKEKSEGKALPNILFIPVDDLRPELGAYGSEFVKTPNIDRLAELGVTFTRAYCQQSVCNPSRASLLTGLRPDSIQVWDLKTSFRKNVPDVVTLPQFFKQRDYTCIGLGKTFHNNDPEPCPGLRFRRILMAFPLIRMLFMPTRKTWISSK